MFSLTVAFIIHACCGTYEFFPLTKRLPLDSCISPNTAFNILLLPLPTEQIIIANCTRSIDQLTSSSAALGAKTTLGGTLFSAFLSVVSLWVATLPLSACTGLVGEDHQRTAFVISTASLESVGCFCSNSNSSNSRNSCILINATLFWRSIVIT